MPPCSTSRTPHAPRRAEARPSKPLSFQTSKPLRSPGNPRTLQRSDLVDFFFPRQCAQCTAASRRAFLCPRCHDALPWLVPPACIRPLLEKGGGALAAVTFQGEVRAWIHRFKYPASGLASLDPAATGIARMLARAAGRRAPLQAADWLVPIPLHPRRFRQRGFNPAALLAREIARPLGLAVAPRWLVRQRDTRPQAGLDAGSRARNVAGAFACRRTQNPLPSRAWLVDDVTTTGATLASAAAALHEAGVREVMGLCLARTPTSTGDFP